MMNLQGLLSWKPSYQSSYPAMLNASLPYRLCCTFVCWGWSWGCCMCSTHYYFMLHGSTCQINCSSEASSGSRIVRKSVLPYHMESGRHCIWFVEWTHGWQILETEGNLAIIQPNVLILQISVLKPERWSDVSMVHRGFVVRWADCPCQWHSFNYTVIPGTL